MSVEARRLDTTLAAILAHPLRCKILTFLDTRAASPKQMAEEFGEPIGNVSYHVRCLEEMGAIELVETAQRRGATEHFYRDTSRPLILADEVAALSVEHRQDIARFTFQLLAANVETSLAEGAFGRRPEHCMVRIPGYVDEEGWAELAGAFTAAYERVFDIMAASVERLGKAKDPKGIPVVTGLTFFEMP